jgi:hypothetical protein
MESATRLRLGWSGRGYSGYNTVSGCGKELIAGQFGVFGVL